ncbi:hypothetical protein LIER_07816 [Lithospermum erythrorhizon]|uniref:Uncharacterized protein n=1 Tax=Lithospermum erythrorhizon TaxID=34254 RepID=A0AAV3PBM4_LITER
MVTVTSSPSGGRSPSSDYSSSVVPAPGRSSSPEYTPTVVDHYVYRHRWVALCDRLRGRRLAQLGDMEYEIFEQLEADLEEDASSKIVCQSLRKREILSHLVDSVASRRLLERNQAALSELAVITQRVDFYASLVRALKARQELLDMEMTAVDQTFRRTATVAIHFSDLEGQLEARLGALEHLIPF